MELIDLSAAIQKIRDEGVLSSGYSETEIEDDVVRMLEELPTVDAILVVRCRDCKSANVRDDMGEDFYECSQNGVTVFCNGGHFCGYGEPRTPPAE